MPNRFSFETGLAFKIVEIVFIAAGLSLFSMPAKAGFQAVGFQWVAPAEQASPPNYAPAPNNSWSPASTEAPPPMASAPTVPVTKGPTIPVTHLAGENPEALSPIVIEGQPLIAPPSPPASSSLSPSPSLPPIPGQGQSGSLGVLPITESSSNSTVEGFANNVPLAVALREILPPGYGFSIDQDVDLGTLVSFEGGKPWRETLASTLKPSGLVMREQNKMVAIGRTPEGGAGEAAAPLSEAAGPSLSPPSPVTQNGAAPASVASVPPWPGPTAYGPKPILTQPSVSLPPPSAPPPPVSSSRLSSASVVDTWTAERGETLHKVLQDWSRRAGAEFQWSAEYDYPLEASISFTGTFEEAVRSLLSGFEEAHPQPVAELHANSGAGQMVLVVQTRGNSYTD